LKEIFLTLQVGFERLPPCLQKFFARLGAMKRFHLIDLETLAALWADTPEELDLQKAGLLVDQLQAAISPFEPAPGQALKWRLHEQTHLFAKSKLEEAGQGEQELAHQWFARAVQAGNYTMPSTSLSEAAKAHLADRLESERPHPIDVDALFRLAQLLIFGIDPGREVIEQNIHRLTSYEYFVARSLDQLAYGRRKWFWLIHIDLGALLFLNTLFSKNRWARPIEGVLLMAFVLFYGQLCCAMTKSTCLWSQLWKRVSERIPKDESPKAR
jgi:hypothetical protein